MMMNEILIRVALVWLAIGLTIIVSGGILDSLGIDLPDWVLKVFGVVLSLAFVISGASAVVGMLMSL